jgi:hypothetical protein
VGTLYNIIFGGERRGGFMWTEEVEEAREGGGAQKWETSIMGSEVRGVRSG